MEKIVFVIGDRNNPAAHHVKKSGTVTVGRSYACDIIINDSHIEGTQLIYHLDDGVRTVEVMNSANCVFRNDMMVRPGRYPFVSGDEWALGKTRIHVFNEQHTIEPAKKILVQEFSGDIASQVGAIFTATTILAGWIGFQAWISNYQPIELGKDIAEAFTSSGYAWFVLLWSSVMALVCRFKSRHSQFGLLLMAGTLYAILSTGFDTAFNYLSYGLNLDSGWKVFYYAGATLLLAAFMLGCFSLIMNMRGMKYMAVGLAVCWFGFDYLGDIADQESLQPAYNQSVKPPFAVLIKPQTIEQFIQHNGNIFAKNAKDE